VVRAPDSAEVRALLLSREARGLRVPLIARMALLVFAVVNITVFSVFGKQGVGDSPVTVPVFATLLLSLAINVYLLVLLRREQRVETVGLVGAGFDALLLLAFSGLAQWAGAHDGLGPGYVFKTELAITVVTIVVLNGLALRPRYPLLVGLGAVVALLVPAARMLLDPATRYSSDWSDVYAGTASDGGQVVMTVVLVIGATAAVSYAAHVARATIRRGIDQEVESARVQQEQLRVIMREKVDALARLVAGVSHEINSPLGALRSNVDTQSRVLEQLEAVVGEDGRGKRLLGVGQKTIGGISAAAERIATLESSLRSLAHLDEAELQRTDLHRELDSVLAALRRELGQAARITLEGGKLPEVLVSAREINQALLAVITYAVGAAGPSGTVTVRTSAQQGWVSIAVEDTGPGIDADALSTLFDVSFEAKGDRVAADLRLAIAQSIVQQHGGEISVESGSSSSSGGGGTTLTIRLPVGARPA
jgi:signal transduction histidine kinase